MTEIGELTRRNIVIDPDMNRIVQDIHDELVSWEISKKTKRDLEEMRNYLVRRINAEL